MVVMVVVVVVMAVVVVVMVMVVVVAVVVVVVMGSCSDRVYPHANVGVIPPRLRLCLWKIL